MTLGFIGNVLVISLIVEVRLIDAGGPGLTVMSLSVGDEGAAADVAACGATDGVVESLGFLKRLSRAACWLPERGATDCFSASLALALPAPAPLKTSRSFMECSLSFGAGSFEGSGTDGSAPSGFCPCCAVCQRGEV